MSPIFATDPKVWHSILSLLKPMTGEIYFTRWLSMAKVVADNAEQVILEVPNYMAKVWVESNFLPQLATACSAVLGAARTFEIVMPEGAANPPPEFSEGEFRAAARRTVSVKTTIAASPVEERLAKSGLNDQYTFDNFVVGDNCQYSHAAAMAVAEKPGQTYNPLFLYGGPGVGKSHLVQAIGHRLVTRRPELQVVYMSAERFTNEFIEAMRIGKLKSFRDRYRKVDAMLIDDIHFLAGKMNTQEEFFHTFNDLIQGGRQMILVSDRPPSEIAKLENRLVSRFEWGLTAEVQAPRMETRMAILRMKMIALKAIIDDKLVAFLAERILSNVRRLEGGLTRLLTYVSLNNRQPTVEESEHLLKDILSEEARKQITIDRIQKRVAEHFDIRLADMTSRKRPANIAHPRQIAMYLARDLTPGSLADIGEAFGGRDHGTVIHACKRISDLQKTDEKLRQDLLAIRRMLEAE